MISNSTFLRAAALVVVLAGIAMACSFGPDVYNGPDPFPTPDGAASDSGGDDGGGDDGSGDDGSGDDGSGDDGSGDDGSGDDSSTVDSGSSDAREGG